MGASLEVARAGHASRASGLPPLFPAPLAGIGWGRAGSVGRGGIGPTFFLGGGGILPGALWREAPQSSLLRAVGSACSGRRGRKPRGLQVGLGHCCTRSSAKIRRELAAESGLLRARGRGGLGRGGAETAPAAVVRAPWEVRLFPVPRTGVLDRREQTCRAFRGSARATGGSETWGAGCVWVPSTKNGHLSFCERVSSLVLTYFLG